MPEDAAEHLTLIVNEISDAAPTVSRRDAILALWRSIQQMTPEERDQVYSALPKFAHHLNDGFITYLEVGNQTANELDLSKAEQYLDKKEKEIALLERASQLRRRFWKYKKPDDAEVWATRWIAAPIAHLFPAERREEWLGDLYAENLQLMDENYPRWMINTINIGKTIVLVSSALRIRVSDLISLAFGRQK